jgi:hypothetical protein
MFNMMGQSSAAHGGGNRLAVGRRAQTASGSVNAALDALAAVNGQGTAAMVAFRSGKRDPAFKRKVLVKRAKPPTLSPGPGLDAASVAALNKLLVAEAKANALVAAAATALWRARAAHRKKNKSATRSQLRAASKFAGQAATALKALPALRGAAATALIAGQAAEVFPTEAAVQGFVDSVRRSGLPASLRGPLTRLGASSADVKRLRAGVVDSSVTSGAGPVLIKPLNDPERAKERELLIKGLTAFSRKARRHRLAR